VLLVADECHRYGSETYSRALDAPFSATLGLSATPERAHDDGMAQFVVPRLGPVVFTYDHDRGIQEGVISNFTTCFVGVDFAPIERGEHERLTRELTAAHRSLTEQFDFLRTAPSFIAAVRQLAQRDEEGLAAHYLKIAGERRRVVTSAHARHEVVAWLAERGAFAGARTLFFHESIADSEYVASTLQDHGIHAAAHHSQLDRDARRARLAQFERGELEAVVAPRTLDEGIDVPDASLAVIIAGTRVRRQTIQRIGRVLRRADGKHTANVVIIYVRGSGDDPRSRNAPDGARELLQRPSTITRLWPSEAEDLLRFVVG
jgi:RNA polymerase primary sigma factor